MVDGGRDTGGRERGVATTTATEADRQPTVGAGGIPWLRGLGAAAAIVAGLVLARLFGLVELAALSVAAAVALAADGAWFVLALSRTPDAVARLPFDAVPIGVNARAEIEVANRQDRGHTLPCEIHWHNSTTTAPHGTTSTTTGLLGVGSCRPGDSLVVTHDLDNRRRGVTSIAGTTLVVRSPLRVWNRAQLIAAGGEVLVWPRLHSLTRDQAPPSDGLSTEQTQVPMPSQPDGELVGLRPYVPGDDIRMIHWRTSARRNYPHVVQKEPPLTPDGIRIWLDTRVADMDDTRTLADFERALSAAASVIHHYATANLPVEMFIPGETSEEPERLDGTARDLLNHLALARPQTGTVNPDPGRPAEVGTNGEAESAAGMATGLDVDLAISSSSDADIPTDCPTLACWTSRGPGSATPAAHRFDPDPVTVHWAEGTPLHDAWTQLLEAADEAGGRTLQRQP